MRLDWNHWKARHVAPKLGDSTSGRTSWFTVLNAAQRSSDLTSVRRTNDVQMHNDDRCLGKIKSTLRPLSDWQQVEQSSMYWKPIRRNPFNKFRDESDIRHGSVGLNIHWIQWTPAHSRTDDGVLLPMRKLPWLNDALTIFITSADRTSEICSMTDVGARCGVQDLLGAARITANISS